ncbi:MAG: hypothetical protein AAF568_01800, partial [Pseudomonadota bacterium]
GTNGFKIDGDADSGLLGRSVDTAGDVNGDNIDDILIGQPGTSNSSGAFLIFGRDTAFTETIDPTVTGNGSLGFVFEAAGPNNNDNLGFAVSGAGDVDNDGFDDLLLGATAADPLSQGNDSSEGAGYFIRGGPSNLVDLDNDDGLADGVLGLANADDFGAILTTSNVGDSEQAGFAVSELGDINGDGFGDFAVGAPRDDGDSGVANGSEGRLHVLFGVPYGVQDLRRSDGESGVEGFVIDGLADGDQLGRSVAGGGDVNGDGLDDFIVGAPYTANSFGTNVGEAYVIFGRRQYRQEVAVDELDGTNGFKLNGLRQNDFTGISTNILGDVNGDGFDDIGVGAHFFDTLGVGQTGAFFVIFGKAGAFDPVIDLGALDGDDGFMILGSGLSDQIGRYTGSALGDVNGDGFDDILVGDERALNLDVAPFSFTGRAHIIFGQKAQGSVTRIGTDEAQTQNGGFGDDLIQGFDGNDTLIGHEGDDTLEGGAGNDQLRGGADDDRMLGGSGVDRFFLGDNTGENQIFGGSNADILDLIDATTGATIRLADGSITINDQTSTFQSVESALGTIDDDVIAGTSRSNFLSGRAGDDMIRGNSGDDQLLGGGGTDMLFGGGGADMFTFNGTTDSRPGATRRDFIMDFEQGVDLIRLENIDADETTTGDQAFTFIERNLFSGTPGEMRFVFSPAQGFTIVSADTDGDQVIDFQIEFVGAFNLTVDDFIL